MVDRGLVTLFLIRRLGISPEASLMILALYWAILLVGRIRLQLNHGPGEGRGAAAGVDYFGVAGDHWFRLTTRTASEP